MPFARKSFTSTLRCMSVYNPYYVDPVVKKEAQNEEKLKELAYTRIKSAPSNFSSSSLQNEAVTKITNMIMEGGQKILARSILEKGFLKMKRTQVERYHLAKTDEEKASIEMNPKTLLIQAIENVRPLMITIKVRRGGAKYNVPVPITEKKSYFLARKWLIEASNDKAKKVHFPEKFAWEILDAANNTGRVVKRKQDLHKECEANRAYAHYRWK